MPQSAALADSTLVIWLRCLRLGSKRFYGRVWSSLEPAHHCDRHQIPLNNLQIQCAYWPNSSSSGGEESNLDTINVYP